MLDSRGIPREFEHEGEERRCVGASDPVRRLRDAALADVARVDTEAILAARHRAQLAARNAAARVMRWLVRPAPDHRVQRGAPIPRRRAGARDRARAASDRARAGGPQYRAGCRGWRAARTAVFGD